MLYLHLLAPVDDILREGESSHAGPADHAVVAGRRVSHLHRRKLEETFSKSNATQKQLSAKGKKLVLK